MLIVLFVIFFAIFVIGAVNDENTITLFGVVIVINILIAICILIGLVIDGRVIADKIAMYEEENVKIETSIDNVVSEYMKHESETFIELKDGDGINLITLYPDLKSDELVKLQIETYRANNAKIKELKESKLNISNYKWWLYFGK